jgi:outer membrane protein OmpA-like peptidoglycan-associated protein
MRKTRNLLLAGVMTPALIAGSPGFAGQPFGETILLAQAGADPNAKHERRDNRPGGAPPHAPGAPNLAPRGAPPPFARPTPQQQPMQQPAMRAPTPFGGAPQQHAPVAQPRSFPQPSFPQQPSAPRLPAQAQQPAPKPLAIPAPLGAAPGQPAARRQPPAPPTAGAPTFRTAPLRDAAPVRVPGAPPAVGRAPSVPAVAAPQRIVPPNAPGAPVGAVGRTPGAPPVARDSQPPIPPAGGPQHVGQPHPPGAVPGGPAGAAPSVAPVAGQNQPPIPPTGGPQHVGQPHAPGAVPGGPAGAAPGVAPVAGQNPPPAPPAAGAQPGFLPRGPNGGPAGGPAGGPGGPPGGAPVAGQIPPAGGQPGHPPHGPGGGPGYPNQAGPAGYGHPPPVAGGLPPAIFAPPRRSGPSISPAGAAAIGAAAGLVGGFLLAQPGARRLDDIHAHRHEYAHDGITVIEEPGRTIVRDGGGVYIRHDENERFRDLGVDLHTERRGDQFVSFYRPPDGGEVLTYTDANGVLLRRIRRLPNGREIVLIDNGFRGPPRAFADEIVVLPPPPMPIPHDRYIVDYGAADEGVVYEALTAPPLAPLPRRYTLDEVRHSPALRSYTRSVDIDTINFDSGSWTVAPDQAQRLSVIAAALNEAIRRNPSEVFLIEGHTDRVGSDVDNLSLSDHRAQEVAAILTRDFGVPAANLTTQGYGEQYPKVDTDGPARENRRVTARRITPLLNEPQAAEAQQ